MEFVVSQGALARGARVGVAEGPHGERLFKIIFEYWAQGHLDLRKVWLKIHTAPFQANYSMGQGRVPE